MKIAEIRMMAKTMGIVTGLAGNRDKTTLIRAIQQAEGSFDCFGTATAGICDQTYCLWRSDCLGANRKGD